MTDTHLNRILLLGVPVDRIPRESLEEALLSLIESFVSDNRPKYATSITALFLGKLSGFTLNRRIMPQVLATLRQADFVGINSKELQLLSKLLGNNIEALIRPIDLLLASASLLAKYQKSIFLLGGNESLCEAAGTALKIDFPGLKISGIAAPEIYTKGLELSEAIDSDDAIIEMINAARPTILALNLGHPKQQIWFERICQKIKVPLIIGVGGAFDLYLKSKSGQEPKLLSRLSWQKIKQKAASVLHYCCWVPPLLAYNSVNHLIYNIAYKHYKKPSKPPHLFLSKKEALFIITFPPFVNRNSWDKMLKAMEAALEYENIVLDFYPVRHLNPSGAGLLHEVWKRLRARNINLFIMGVSGDVRTLLKLNGAWDLIASAVVPGPKEILQRLSINQNDNLLKSRVFLSVDQIENQTTISFFGSIHGYDVEEESGFQLDPLINGRNLVVNMQYCTAISNLGFSFLLHLKEYQKREKQSLSIQNACGFIKMQFKYYQLDKYFTFI